GGGAPGMAYQASVNGGSRFHRSEGVLTSLAELGGDAATRAELQAKLALIDTKEAVGRATWPTIVLVVAGSILLATVPVLLIGLAFVLAAATGMTQGAALLLTGFVFAAVAGAVAFLSLREFLHS